MKVALIQDWFTEIGGAEKVFESILALFPDADIFTLTSHDRVLSKLGIDKMRLHESFVAKFPFGRSKYRNYLQFFPKAIEGFDLSGYDLIISSSYSVAKGVITNSNQLHICYCHSPVRYAWDLYHQYLKEAGLDGWGLKSWYARHVLHQLRVWDVISSNRVDFFIANSNYIKKRIEKVYRRESSVIYPPVDVDQFKLEEQKEDFYFTGSRMVPYKRIDLIVKAFSKMPDKRLIVAGTGPDEQKIRKVAGINVEFLGYISDQQMKELMQKAKAFVFAADEDFGIVPVEAQACGTPVICLGKGGTKETVIHGITGIHFMQQTEEELIEAINTFESGVFHFNPIEIRKNSERFSKDMFRTQFISFVNQKLERFHQRK